MLEKYEDGGSFVSLGVREGVGEPDCEKGLSVRCGTWHV